MGRALLDHGNLHAELRGADGADIPARPRADDDEIVTHVAVYPPHCSGVSVSSPRPLSHSPVRLLLKSAEGIVGIADDKRGAARATGAGA